MQSQTAQNSQKNLAHLINDTAGTAMQLFTAEAHLLRVEIMQQINGEIMLTRRLIIGSTMGTIGVTMLLMGIVLKISSLLPAVSPWLAAIVLGLLLLGGGFTISFLAWRRHKALAQIRVELEADIANMLKLRAEKR